MGKRRKKKKGRPGRLGTEERMVIQACIHARYTLGETAERLGVHKSTVLREIRRWSRRVPGKQMPCPRKHLGVCNKCPKRAHCNLEKAYYDFMEADERSAKLRSTCRSGTRIPPGELAEADAIVTEGIRLGQSIHHIHASSPRLRAICSERTVRRLVYAGVLSARAHELRRYVRYRRGKGETRPRGLCVRDIGVLVGRSHRDFLERREERPRECLVQLDSVIGSAADRTAILTITFPKYGFQFGALIRKGRPGDVVQALRRIFRRLPPGLAEEAFRVILADNGTEFSWLDRLERGEDGRQVRHVYFTTPYRATDKAECERLHELVRYCVPKGRSVDRLTQEDLDAMYSNINSYVRKSHGDRTPYDVMLRRFGKDFLEAIGIRRVPKKKVRLLPIV